MPRILQICLCLMLSTFSASASDSWSEIFRDWRATCSADGGCEASTGDQGANVPGDTVRLILERTSNESPGWFIALEFLRKPTRPDRAITLAIPGRPEIVISGDSDFRAYGGPERFYVTAQSALNALLPAVLAGDVIKISYFDVTNESRAYPLSLSGVSASLLWIEEQMRMVGAPRIASAPVGLPPATPSAEDNIRQAGIPETVQAYHERTSSCEIYDDQELKNLGFVIEPLGATSTLYALPCTHHAYNVTYRLYVRDIGEIGGIRTLHFATYSDTTNWSGTDLLFNIQVEGRQLSAFYKGRGLGDCGTLGFWTWQDYEYRLERFAAQTDCKGVPADQWPVLFSAR